MYLTVHSNCLEPKAKKKHIKHILKVSDGGNGQRLSICSDGEERIRISFGKEKGRKKRKRKGERKM